MADTNGTNGHTTSPGLLSAFSALVNRTLIASRMGWQFGGERKIQEVLGYKQALCYADYKAYYLRGDLAHRLVKAYPEATWSSPPTVQEDDEHDTETPFEQAWVSLCERLHVYDALERADTLANLGQYSVLLIGLRNQALLAEPAQKVRSAEDVLYLTPYSEEFAEIATYEENAASPTFGKPRTYRFNFARTTSGGSSQRTVPARTGIVHASRVLHIAEDLLDDDVFGIPRLEPIYNKLEDLLKVVGGSAEMFWRDAKRRIALELRDDYQLSPTAAEQLTEEVDEYMHQLRDFIRVQGVNVKDLSGLVANPKEHFDVLLNVIAGTTGIPKRVLMGSERGELASTQDEHAWLQRVSRRQQQFGEARMLRPLIGQLITLGALPEPAQPYQVIWDNLFALSEEKQATVAKDIATAASTMSPGMPERVIPLPEYRERYLGLTPESEYAEALPDLEPGEEESEDTGEEDEEV